MSGDIFPMSVSHVELRRALVPLTSVCRSLKTRACLVCSQRGGGRLSATSFRLFHSCESVYMRLTACIPSPDEISQLSGGNDYFLLAWCRFYARQTPRHRCCTYFSQHRFLFKPYNVMSFCSVSLHQSSQRVKGTLSDLFGCIASSLRPTVSKGIKYL